MKLKRWSFVGIVLLATSAFAQDFWGSWPDGTDPKVVGKRIAQNLVDRKDFFKLTKGGLFYPEVCTAYGSLRFANEIGDNDLRDKIIARYKDILNEDGMTKEDKPRRLVQKPTNVDASIFGALPLEIYILTNDKRYLDLGLKSADAQWASPTTKQQATMDELKIPADLTWQSRLWIDDMFMITGLQMQAYRATKDAKYMDRTAKEMAFYLDRLQQPNGLFYHGTDKGQFFWGRGDGWVAVGMAEVLTDLPADHPLRPKIMEGYTKMMAALLKVQGKDGMWHQILDDPNAWAESSCTGMFTFAMARGVRSSWLQGDDYKDAAKKAWVGLCGYVDQDANVKEVCIGTNKGDNEDFYLKRPRDVGDMHGQAGAIWAAWAMIK